MELHELNRMFDQLAPAPEREEELLDRLLQEERKGSPMKKLKKLTAAAVAAALMVTACAAAVVTGFDQRLIDYFGASPEQVELLAPGAIPVDVTAEDNGSTLHITQVLMDRYSILVLMDFTAPEGTVLDASGEDGYQFNNPGDIRAPRIPAIVTKEREIPLSGLHAGYSMEVLPDADPSDNHLTLLFYIGLRDGIQPDWEMEELIFYAKGLYQWSVGSAHPVCSGDWTCRIPITWKDTGWRLQANQPVGQMNGSDITVKEIYLSPITLQLCMESKPIESAARTEGLWADWTMDRACEHIILTAQDGTIVPLTIPEGRSGGCDTVLSGWVWPQEQRVNFSLTEISDPALFQGGKLTLLLGETGQEVFEISLDDLAPVK